MIIIAINVRKTKDNEVSILMRIMTNYLQIITTSASFSSKYPTAILDAISPVQKVGGASDTFLSFDCFITDYEIKGPFPDNVYFKLFLSAILPLVLTVIVGAIWIVMHFISRKWAPNLKRWFIISFISIMFLLHPKLTEQSINVFRCVTIDDGKSRMRIDTEVDWYSSTHLSWCVFLGLPILFVYVIGAPLLALILLAKNIRKSPQNEIRQYFLIFYQGLKHDRFYWEFVNTLRKVFLVFILLLSGYTQVLISTALLVASARLQIKLSPYKNEQNNKIELFAITAGVIVLLSSLIFQEEESVGFLNILAIIFIIATNLIFILEWSYKMVQEFEEKHRLFRLTSLILANILWKKRSFPELKDKLEVNRKKPKPLLEKGHNSKTTSKSEKKPKKKKLKFETKLQELEDPPKRSSRKKSQPKDSIKTPKRQVFKSGKKNDVTKISPTRDRWGSIIDFGDLKTKDYSKTPLIKHQSRFSRRSNMVGRSILKNRESSEFEFSENLKKMIKKENIQIDHIGEPQYSPYPRKNNKDEFEFPLSVLDEESSSL